MKTLLLSCFIGVSMFCIAQNNALVINNDAYIVINGGVNGTEAVVVIDQPHEDGIITTGTGGNIITQGEFDYVKWNIGTSTGTYTVPFTADANNAKLPLTLNITSAGTGSGYVAFSSWDVSAQAGSFDNTPYPSEVTHMAGANGVPDNSGNAIDRFWVIDINDPLGTGETYLAIPTPSINFSYNIGYAPEMADGNTAGLAGLLGGQHFDPASNDWLGSGSGTGACFGCATGIWGVDNGAGLVVGVVPDNGDWFRTWTLSNFNSPLPVELNSYEVECKDEGILVQWQTASEINASHYEVYKSFDGYDFELIGTVQAAGNSTNTTNYTLIDESLNLSNAIYRLVEVDNDGVERDLATTTVPNCVSDASFDVYGTLNGDVVITLNSSVGGDYDVVLFDALGKQVSASQLIYVNKGFNRFDLSYDQLAFGTYLIQMSNQNKSFVKKLVIR